MRGSLPVAATLSLSVFFSGCASKPIYHWGSYEQSVHHSLNGDEKVPLGEQIDRLNSDIKEAGERTSEGKTYSRIPPGVYAQLGYLYYKSGQMELAQQSFEAEKRLYPESKVLMDRFLGRLKK